MTHLINSDSSAHSHLLHDLKSATRRFEQLLQTIEKGSLEEFRRLLDTFCIETDAASNADVLRHNVTGRGVNLLHLAALQGREDIIDNILSQTENDLLTTDQDGNTVLHYAARSSSIRAVKRLKGLIEEDSIYRPNSKIITPLQYALHSNCDEIPLYLLANAKWTETLSQISPEGTILQWAVLGGRIEVVKELLRIMPNAQIIEEHTQSRNGEIPPALVLAGSMADDYCLEICKLLSEKGVALLCVKAKDAEGSTVVHNVAEAENIKTIRFLCENFPETIREICSTKDPLVVTKEAQIREILAPFCSWWQANETSCRPTSLDSEKERTDSKVISVEKKKDAEALKARALEETNAGRLPEALNLYQELIEVLEYREGINYCQDQQEEISRVLAVTFSNIAYVQLKLNKTQDAMRAARHAINLNNNWFEGYYRLAMCYKAEEDYEEATQQMYEALLRNGSDPDVQKSFHDLLRQAQAQHKANLS